MTEAVWLSSRGLSAEPVASAEPTCGRTLSRQRWVPPTEAALVFHMLCMFGQLSPLLGDLKISLLRTGIACSRGHSFGFFGSLPVFFRSFHANALRCDRKAGRPIVRTRAAGRAGFAIVG